MAAPLLLRGIPLLLRGIPLLRLRLQQRVSSVGLFTTVSRPSYCAASELSQPPDNAAGAKDRQKFSRRDTPEYRQWKDREAEILRDIEQITFLTKDILHSGSVAFECGLRVIEVREEKKRSRRSI